MTCQECELALTDEVRSEAGAAEMDAHLTCCAECREFAVELRANSEALREFAGEAMPVVSMPPGSMTKAAGQSGWKLAAAIAAMLALAIWIFTSSRSRLVLSKTPEIQNTRAPVAPVVLPAAAMKATAEMRGAAPVRYRAAKGHIEKRKPKILQIKMLTDDPNVVIYWQVEN